MTWYIGLAVWIVIGLASCILVCYDEHKRGIDFELFDLFLVIVTTAMGPIFSIWLLKEYLKENKIVLIKGRKHEPLD
jgi:hypothetical protein